MTTPLLDYLDINLDTVWDTVQAALPGLLHQLATVRQAAEDLRRDSEGSWSSIARE